MKYLYFLIGLLVAFIYKFWRTQVRARRLGNLLLAINNREFKSSIIGIALLRLGVALVAEMMLLTYYSDRPILSVILFSVVFGVVMISEIMTLVQLSAKTGIYDNGVVCNTGIMMYDEISYFYETTKQKNYIYLLSFSPKVFINKQGRLYISQRDLTKARKYLTKKIDFESERKGLRKI